MTRKEEIAILMHNLRLKVQANAADYHRSRYNDDSTTELIDQNIQDLKMYQQELKSITDEELKS